MSEIDPQEFGRLTAEVAHLEKQVQQLGTDIRALRTEIMASLTPLTTMASEARGGWRVMLTLCAVAGAVGAALMKAAAWWIAAGPKV